MTEINGDGDSVLDGNLVHNNEITTSGDLVPKFSLNFSFANKLLFLEKQAIEIQYQLAYLSTLGGAYHLCNNPQKALTIAIEQEKVGRKLGSSAIVIRSKVFQAVNLGLLGEQSNCRKLFEMCKMMATKYNWTDMLGFVTASEQWYMMNHMMSTEKPKRRKEKESCNIVDIRTESPQAE